MLKPRAHVTCIEDVNLAQLWDEGVRGLILDLDNTLLAYGNVDLPPARHAWIDEAKHRGFALVILSNNFPDRVEALGRVLGVPTVPSALKPLPFAYVRALRHLRTPRRQVVIIGDQLLTDVLGAAFFGISGILTEPLLPKDFPLTRVLRWMERRLLGRKFAHDRHAIRGSDGSLPATVPTPRSLPPEV